MIFYQISPVYDLQIKGLHNKTHFYTYERTTDLDFDKNLKAIQTTLLLESVFQSSLSKPKVNLKSSAF